MITVNPSTAYNPLANNLLPQQQFTAFDTSQEGIQQLLGQIQAAHQEASPTNPNINPAASTAQSVNNANPASTNSTQQQTIITNPAINQNILAAQNKIKTVEINKTKGPSPVLPILLREVNGVEEYIHEPSGLRVLVLKDPNAKAVFTAINSPVGASMDPKDKQGLAHFAEHIICEAETKMYKQGDVEKLTRTRAGERDAYTSRDNTLYLSYLPAGKEELGIRIAKEQALNTIVTDKAEHDRQKSIILDEAKRQDDCIYTKLQNRLLELTFPNHNYATAILGDEKSIKSISVADIAKYRNQYMSNLNDKTLVISGPVDSQEIRYLVAQIFADVATAKKEKPNSKVAEPKIDYDKRKEATATIEHEGKDHLLGLGFPGPKASSPEANAIEVLLVILFGGQDARVNKAIHKESGVGAHFSGQILSFSEASLIKIIGHANNKHINLNSLYDEFFEKIITDIKENGVTEEEIRNAVNILNKSNESTKENIFNRTQDFISKHLSLNLSLEESSKENPYDNVSADQIKAVADKYLKNPNRIFVIPEKKAQKKESTETKAPEYKNIEPLTDEELERLDKIAVNKYSKDKGPLAASANLNIKSMPLNNNAQLLFHPINSKIAYINGFFPAGKITEPIQRKYIATITSNLLQSWGQNPEAKMEISKKFKELGVLDFNIYNGREFSGFEIAVPVENTTAIMQELYKFLHEPSLNADAFSGIKSGLEHNRKLADDNPAEIAAVELSRIICPEGHPNRLLSHPETKKMLEDIQLEEIKNYFFNNYRDDINISVAAQEDKLPEIYQAAQKVVTGLNTGKYQALRQRQQIAYIPASEQTKSVVKIKNDIPHATVKLGHNVPFTKIETETGKLSRDYYKAKLASFILNSDTRLSSIRENFALTYYISFDFSAAMFEAGLSSPASISFTCDTERTNEALAKTDEILQNFVNNGVNKAELIEAQRYQIEAYLRDQFQDGKNISDFMEEAKMLGMDPKQYLKERREILESITIDELNEFIKSKQLIDPKKLNLVVVQPDLKAQTDKPSTNLL